ncbi:MAG: ATP-binding cassette domain-containing protein, partial [Clostridia bacterium]|nr:ATP-binding cassette domain-containing protein [Clostridia bacterium]
MLRLKNIDKTFGAGTPNEKILFTDFNLEIKEGEFVGVVGSNGSGKTTTLNIISGDIDIDNGEVILDDKNITKLPNYKRAKEIARVFQNPSMGTCSSMTIFENLSLADNKLKSYNLTKGLNIKAKDKYRTLLEQLGMGLENRLYDVVGTLSGGQRQAISIIMSTLIKPKLLLLDEHTAALDPKSSDTVMELTQKIVSEQKITTLMVTHNLRHAVQYGTRTVMMHDGN